jgi:hypothetical protein
MSYPLIATNFADSILGGELHFETWGQGYGPKLIKARPSDDSIVRWGGLVIEISPCWLPALGSFRLLVVA